MGAFKTHPELDSRAQTLREAALRGNSEALDLLIQMHRIDQRGTDIVELGETFKQSVEKVFAKVSGP